MSLALTRGEKAFEPGLLARAHRGFLYIDEVNLLEDHLVDALLDVAAQYLAQGFMHQVGRRVIAHRTRAALGIDARLHRNAHRQ